MSRGILYCPSCGADDWAMEETVSYSRDITYHYRVDLYADDVAWSTDQDDGYDSQQNRHEVRSFDSNGSDASRSLYSEDEGDDEESDRDVGCVYCDSCGYATDITLYD